MPPKTCLVICGPTASGKTPLALALAREFNGCVINADSMQIYDHLRILTARPTESDFASLDFPYYLDGVLSGNTRGSTGWWLKEASKIINESFEKGHIPILVGGTGLYLKCLMEGISEIPEIPRDIQMETRALGATHTLDELQQQLNAQMEKTSIKPTLYKDKQRLLRALEVLKATGQPIESFYSQKKTFVECNFLTVLLQPPRDVLYRKIDERFDMMMKEGALDEVKNFLKQPLDSDHPILKATGVVPLQQYLKNDLTLEEAVTKAKQDTRNFAKRQITWFKGQMSTDLILDPYKNHLKEKISLVKKTIKF